MSFVRSGGKRGAALENLRGTKGANFEGKADVERVNDASTGICGCMGEGGGSDKNVIVLVKGPFAFIFVSETASSPKYAISLVNMKAVAKQSSRGTFPVTLETSLGDAEYGFSFADADTASSFVKAVEEESAAGKAELVRKRLGHEHLLNKRASIRYAESVAVKKVDDAPPAPVSTEEILAGVAAAAM